MRIYENAIKNWRKEQEKEKNKNLPCDPKLLYKDKNVIILGPASCVFDDCKDLDVDFYDLVIRTGKHDIEQVKSGKLGARTDIIYHSFDLDEFGCEECEHWEKDKIILIARNNLTNPSARKRFEERCAGRNITLLHEDVDLFLNKYTKLMGCNPSTGVLGIFHILSGEPQKLTIVGFDFYQSSLYFYEDSRYEDQKKFLKYVQDGAFNHHPDKQLEFFKQEIKKYPNCELIGKLKQLCNE